MTADYSVDWLEIWCSCLSQCIMATTNSLTNLDSHSERVHWVTFNSPEVRKAVVNR